jgi:transcriptional regulator with XRE-family HTH domain
MSTTERILGLISENGITAKKLTLETGLPHSTITEWKKGRNNPSAEAIKKIAAYFNVSTDYLLGQSETKTTHNEQSLSTERQMLLSVITDLSEEELAEVLNHVRFVKSKRNQ